MKRILLLIGVFLLMGCTVSEAPVPETPMVNEEIQVDAKETLQVEHSPEQEVQEELIEPEREEIVEEEEVVQELIDPLPPQIINGKTLEQRLEDAYDNLHEAGSSGQILDDFPDVELIHEDSGEGSSFFPKEILPFHYYYSGEADKTFNLCGIGRSVFICDGKLDRTIAKEDIDSGRCAVTPIYMEDPRVGGSGNQYKFD